MVIFKENIFPTVILLLLVVILPDSKERPWADPVEAKGQIGHDFRYIKKWRNSFARGSEWAITKALNQIEISHEKIVIQHPSYTVHFLKEGIRVWPKSGAPFWAWSNRDAAVSSPVYNEGENKIVYNHYKWNEEYLIKPTSIEQQFVLFERCDDPAEPVTIIGDIKSTGRFRTTDDGWSWTNEIGEVKLGDVFAYDRNEKPVMASMRVSANESIIEVSAESLADATFPLIIDPEIEPNDFRISKLGVDEDNVNYSSSYPAVAHIATSDPATYPGGVFLVVWEGGEAGEFEIYGQLVDGDNGELIDANPDPNRTDIKISNMNNSSDPDFDALRPDVAASGNEFFVVWYGDDAVDNQNEIYAQRIDADPDPLKLGQKIGTQIRISNMGATEALTFNAFEPSVVFNNGNDADPLNDKYYVVWFGDHVTDNKYEILSQHVSVNGVITEMFTTVSAMNFNAYAPRVALNSSSNEYMVTWFGDHATSGEFEIFVHRVSGATGGELGNDMRISDMGPVGNASHDGVYPSIAYNADANNYLVVWQADDNVDEDNEIYGQMITSLGAETGTNDFRISEMGIEGSANFDALVPRVSYDRNLNQFMVVWHGDDNSVTVDGENEIFAQLISATGVEIGVDVLISDAGGLGNPAYAATNSAIAYNPLKWLSLIVWRGDDNSTTTVDNENEIWGQLFAELSPQPLGQPTAPLSSIISQSSFSVSFTAASDSPDGYVVLRNSIASPTSVPGNHTVYEVGDIIGNDTVVHVGNAVSFNQSGLAANTTYYYDFFSYNGVNSSTNYLTATPLEANVTTLFPEPTLQAINISIKSVDQNSITLNFTKGNGASRVIVVKEQSVAEVFPADASSYTANSNFLTAPETGTGNKVVALRTGSDNTDVLVENLSAATAYSVRVYEFNGNTTLTNYNTSSATGNPLVVFTLSAEPASQPSMLEFADITATSMTGLFDAAAGDPDGYLVVRKAGSAPAGKPIDGKLYAAGDTVGAGGDGTVVYRGNSLSFNSTALTPETQYEYAIFAYNGNDGSVNYRITTPLTGGATTLAAEPSGQPTTLTFDDVTSSSMELSFAPPSVNPDGYLVIRKATSLPAGKPVDGKTYVAGDTVGVAGDATVAYDGINTSLISSGLQERTVYHYAIFSYNGDGVSRNYRVASPLTGSKTTYAIEPTTQPTGLSFGGYTTSSMSGSFIPPVPGADGYVVLSKKGSSPTDIPGDGQTLTASAIFGESKVVYVGSSTSFINENLDAGSVYHYDVFAFNGSGSTINYQTTDPLQNSAITISPPPEALDATPVGSTSFTARWNASVGASKYELDVSADNFATFLPDYHAREVFSGLEEGVTGLTPVTSYKYRVRAVNASGVSANSLEKTVITTQDPVAFGISPPTYAGKFSVGAKISVEVTGARGPLNVRMHSRKISENALLPSAAVLKSGTTYEITITNEMADELGVEFYFEADDGIGSVTNPTHYFIYKSIDTSPIPFAAGFNGKTSTYQMFSVPYVLDDKTIAGIFNELGAYDQTKWRLFHYDGTGKKYLEFQGGLPNNIELGKGYWFNSASELTEAIGVGTGTVEKANQDDPATITLSQGWNQIGNPYPFPISWEAVLGLEERLGSLQFFENGKYISRDVFKPWTGAFVHADEAITLSIPVLAKTNQSGRTSRHELTADLDAEHWLVPVTLRVSSLEQTSGVGMHPLARTSKDKFDEITVPRFLDYAEMNTYHEEFFSPHFSTDVVPTGGEHAWIFDVKSNLEDQQGELTWDYTSIASSRSSLILIDLRDGRWVDMRTTGSYTFTHKEGRQFRIIYNREGEIRPGVTLLGEAYPNPFNTGLTIPVLIDEPGYRQIGIYDALGRRIRILLEDFSQPGLHEIHWDGKDDGGSEVNKGLLFYQIENKTKSQVRRIIKI